MVVEFKDVVVPMFTFMVDNIRNPISTKPSSSFTNIEIRDAENYLVAIYSNKTEPITNDMSA